MLGPERRRTSRAHVREGGGVEWICAQRQRGHFGAGRGIFPALHAELCRTLCKAAPVTLLCKHLPLAITPV